MSSGIRGSRLLHAGSGGSVVQISLPRQPPAVGPRWGRTERRGCGVGKCPRVPCSLGDRLMRWITAAAMAATDREGGGGGERRLSVCLSASRPDTDTGFRSVPAHRASITVSVSVSLCGHSLPAVVLCKDPVGSLVLCPSCGGEEEEEEQEERRRVVGPGPGGERGRGGCTRSDSALLMQPAGAHTVK